MTKLSFNGKNYAVVATDLSDGKTSCDQCAFHQFSNRFGWFCDCFPHVNCEDYDDEETTYHFEEVTNV